MGYRMLHQFARSDCGTNCENARTSASLGDLAQPGAASGEKCAMFVLVGNLKLGAGDPNDLHKIPALGRDGFSICHHCFEREKIDETTLFRHGHQLARNFRHQQGCASDDRSEERRVGKEWVSKGKYRWSPYH